MSRRTVGWTLLLAGLLLAFSAPAQAQQTTSESESSRRQAERNVTLDVRDAPIKDVLIQIFKQVKIDFSIDPAITGFVTLHVTDQPWHSALRLVMRASRTPLTYYVEGGIYNFRIREIAPPEVEILPPMATSPASAPARHLEVIQLAYIDPADLAQILGIQLIPFNVRGMGALGGMGAGMTGGNRTGLLGNQGGIGSGNNLLLNGSGNGVRGGRSGF